MKKLFAIILAAGMIFALAACGADTSSTPAGSTAQQTSEAAGAGGKVEQIQQAGKLVMMTNAEFPPFEYLSHNAEAGVDIDLAQRVADELGVELEVLNMDFDALIGALLSGKGDIVAAGMSITDERLQQVDFSIPYVDTTLLIIVAADSSISSGADLAGLSIAVQEGTTGDLFVSDYVEDANVLRFKGAVELGNAIKAGKADAAVIDQLTAQNVVNASPDELVLLEEPLGNEQYAMAVAKGDADLLEVVNKVLAEAVENDEVNSLITQHMEQSAG